MNSSLLQKLWLEFNQYKLWLEEQTIAAHTRRAYASRLNQFLVFLATEDNSYEDVLASASSRDRAVEDYKEHLKNSLSYSVTTINTTLSALDHFYNYLGLGQPNIDREVKSKQMPVALMPEEEQALLSIINSVSARNRAIVLLLLKAGLRIGECIALNLLDVGVVNDKTSINIISARRNRARVIVLDPDTAIALSEWIAKRDKRFPETKDQALFLSRLGKRITGAGIDFTLKKLGQKLGFSLSAETLRHTCLINMLISGKDLHLVRKLFGHKRLETTKRYCLPTVTICEDVNAETNLQAKNIDTKQSWQ